MSAADSNAFGSQKNGPGGKTEDIVKQAQEFGRDMKGQASELARNATEAVKTQASKLTDSAKEVASDASEKLRASVSEQKAAGADYVGNVADIIRRTAYEFDADIPQAGHYIRKAASQIENVSDAIRNRDMSEIVGNVQDFARKQPTAFFGAAVLLGFAAVRFLKSGSGSATPSSIAPQASGPNVSGLASSGGGRPASASNVGGTTAGM